MHKEELQHLETKHGPLSSDTEDPSEGNNSEVKIESEEIILTKNGENLTENPELIAKGGENENSAASKETGKETPKGDKSVAKGNRSPNKALQRYHNLSDVLSEGSPVAKKLFNSEGKEVEMLDQARKLLVRTGKVILLQKNR